LSDYHLKNIQLQQIILKSKRKHYFDEGYTINKCPECKEELVEEENGILLAVKSKQDEGQLVTNVPKTRICPNCPVVVFNKRELEKAATLGMIKGKNIQYAVIGIIKEYSVQDTAEEQSVLETIEEQESIIDNISSVYEAFTPRIAPLKIGRNEKCPCGSGKKYKKCCLKKDK